MIVLRKLSLLNLCYGQFTVLGTLSVIKLTEDPFPQKE